MNTAKLLPAVSVLALLLLPGCGEKEGVQSRPASFPRNVKVDVVILAKGTEYKKLTNREETYTHSFDLSTLTLTEDRFDICRKTSSNIPVSERFTYEANQDYCDSYIITEWDGNRFLGKFVAETGIPSWVEVCTVYDRKIECRSVFDEAPPEAIADPDSHQEFITASTTYTMR